MEQNLAESDLRKEIHRLQAELEQLAEERGSVLDAMVLEKSQALDCRIVAYQNGWQSGGHCRDKGCQRVANMLK